MEAEEHFTNRLLADIHISSNFMLLFMQYNDPIRSKFYKCTKSWAAIHVKIVTIFGFLDPAK